MEEPLRSNGKKKKRGKKAVEVLQPEEEEFLHELAVRVREVRLKAGVSQEKFYADTSIHIGRIETGKNNISINTLYRICSYFKISVKDFFGKIKKK